MPIHHIVDVCVMPHFGLFKLIFKVEHTSSGFWIVSKAFHSSLNNQV